MNKELLGIVSNSTTMQFRGQHGDSSKPENLLVNPDTQILFPPRDLKTAEYASKMPHVRTARAKPLGE
jgi:hypothetical protein